MISFLLKKIGYGLLVLFGVVTVVFFLFNLSPGDPVRNMLGENAPEEVAQDMRKKFGLDLSVGERYFLYLNDLSPLSIHNVSDSSAWTFPGEKKYNIAFLIRIGESRGLALKSPYLNRSFLTERNVSSILSDVIPGTVVLALVSMFFAMVIGLLLGVFAALRKDTLYDRLILVLSAVGMAGPSFFVAILVAWVGAILWRDEIHIPIFLIVILLVYIIGFIRLKSGKNIIPKKWLNVGTLAVLFTWILMSTLNVAPSFLSGSLVLPGTGLNMTGSLYNVDVWKGEYLDLSNLILPAITLMIRPLAVVVQLTRSSLLEVMSKDFIRTARAKGLSERRVVFVHALRNALNPVVTAVSGWFASLLAGAVFVEFVFGWKGLGQEMFTAIEKQDLPVVMGGVIIISTAFVLINLMVDLIYGWIDPRVRVGSKN